MSDEHENKAISELKRSPATWVSFRPDPSKIIEEREASKPEEYRSPASSVHFEPTNKKII